MHTTKRKNTLAYLTAFFLLSGLLLIPACTSQELDEPAPQIAAKAITQTHNYYSTVPGSFSDAYHIQLLRYSDGTAAYKQEVIPFNAAQDLVSFAVVNGSASPQFLGGYQVTFPGTGWFIPFDPTLPVHAIGGSGAQMNCECFGSGTCSVGNVTIHNNGGITFDCDWDDDCNEDCIEMVYSSANKGLFVGAVSLQQI